MTKYATLYKRAKTGAIQFWEINVTPGIGHAHITKTSGKLGTENPIQHEECITEGKNIGKANATTAHQQAHLQAESDWKKKKDEGYKSLDDLGLRPIDMTIHDNTQQPLYHIPGTPAQTGKPLALALEEVLPQFNTDANGNVKPMLAKDWNGGKKVKFPCFLQPKLDGVRCLMVVDFTKPDPIQFLSRSGKPYTTLEHISMEVLVSNESVPIKFILDGEIYSDELTFQEIAAAVKKERESSLKLRFRAYDIVNDMAQEERWSVVTQLVDSIASPYIQLVQTLRIDKHEDIKLHHDRWVLDHNYEGAMIRQLHGMYEQGARSSHLLKVKVFDESEFPFIRFEIGQRPEDLIAVCKVVDLSDSVTQRDKEFRAKMQGSAAYKKALQESVSKLGGKLLGTMLTVKHFGWTDDGLPRFPIGKSFRDYE